MRHTISGYLWGVKNKARGRYMSGIKYCLKGKEIRATCVLFPEYVEVIENPPPSAVASQSKIDWCVCF